jgi:hypothetical protein
VLGPQFLARLDPALGLVVDVTNLAPFPITMERFEGAELDEPLPGENLTFDSLNPIVFTPGLLNTTLEPFATHTVDWPDPPPGKAARLAAVGGAVVLRYETSMFGTSLRGVLQGTLDGLVGVAPGSWSLVKGLYHR